MLRTTVFAASAVGLAMLGVSVAHLRGASAIADHRAMLDKYCVTCHNQQAKTAGLMLDKMDLNHVPEGAQTWEKVILKLRGGMMPPQGSPRPDQASVDSFVNWLETSIDRAPTPRPIRAARLCTASIAPNTATRSTICWGWIST